MITKKDLIALADWARRAQMTPLFIESMADFLMENNPRFNRQRWIGYVRGYNGPNGGAIDNDGE